MKRKINRIILSIALVAGFAFTTTPAHAKTIIDEFLTDKGFETEVSAAVSYYSDYVWRGFVLDNDVVMQPEITLSIGGFEGGFWGNWDLESTDALASDEVDGWLGYNFDLGFIDERLSKVGMSVGHTWYAFPETDTHAEEFYFGISLDTFLSPYFTWYLDYGEESGGSADGSYYMVGISHSLDILEEYGITLDLGSELGFNNEAFIAGEGGYYLGTVGLTVPLSEKVTMSPSIGFSSPWGDLDSGGGNDQNEEFYGGVTLAFDF